MQNYKTDVIVWANEQAAFIRSGRFDLLDLEHIADVIEDEGKSEQREFENRPIHHNGNSMKQVLKTLPDEGRY